MPGRLMLDPSLFTSFRTLGLIRAAIDSGELRDVVLPASFLSALERGALSEKTLAYFGASKKEIHDLGNLQRHLPKTLPFAPYAAAAEEKLSEEFQKGLMTVAKDRDILEILNEEWSFLNSQSWIAARTRKSFSAFVKSGAVAVEAGKRVFDKALLRTLKVSPTMCLMS
jgi:hypothetical protein